MPPPGKLKGLSIPIISPKQYPVDSMCNYLSANKINILLQGKSDIIHININPYTINTEEDIDVSINNLKDFKSSSLAITDNEDASYTIQTLDKLTEIYKTDKKSIKVIKELQIKLKTYLLNDQRFYNLPFTYKKYHEYIDKLLFDNKFLNIKLYIDLIIDDENNIEDYIIFENKLSINGISILINPQNDDLTNYINNFIRIINTHIQKLKTAIPTIKTRILQSASSLGSRLASKLSPPFISLFSDIPKDNINIKERFKLNDYIEYIDHIKKLNEYITSGGGILENLNKIITYKKDNSNDKILLEKLNAITKKYKEKLQQEKDIIIIKHFLDQGPDYFDEIRKYDDILYKIDLNIQLLDIAKKLSEKLITEIKIKYKSTYDKIINKLLPYIILKNEDYILLVQIVNLILVSDEKTIKIKDINDIIDLIHSIHIDTYKSITLSSFLKFLYSNPDIEIIYSILIDNNAIEDTEFKKSRISSYIRGNNEKKNKYKKIQEIINKIKEADEEKNKELVDKLNNLVIDIEDNSKPEFYIVRGFESENNAYSPSLSLDEDYLFKDIYKVDKLKTIKNIFLSKKPEKEEELKVINNSKYNDINFKDILKKYDEIILTIVGNCSLFKNLTPETIKIIKDRIKNPTIISFYDDKIKVYPPMKYNINKSVKSDLIFFNNPNSYIKLFKEILKDKDVYFYNNNLPKIKELNLDIKDTLIISKIYNINIDIFRNNLENLYLLFLKIFLIIDNNIFKNNTDIIQNSFLHKYLYYNIDNKFANFVISSDNKDIKAIKEVKSLSLSSVFKLYSNIDDGIFKASIKDKLNTDFN